MADNAEKPAAARSVADQELVDTIMEAPEKFDSVLKSSDQPDSKPELLERPDLSVVAVANEASSPEAGGVGDSVSSVSRTNMLSAVEKPTLRPQEEPVSAENLYFHEDYSSMRKDAVRDPDSPENRAGVVALMKARQQRLEQNQ